MKRRNYGISAAEKKIKEGYEQLGKAVALKFTQGSIISQKRKRKSGDVEFTGVVAQVSKYGEVLVHFNHDKKTGHRYSHSALKLISRQDIQ